MADFFIRYKKIFIALGFVLVVLILGYGLYVLFFQPSRPETEVTPSQQTNNVPGNLPAAQNGAGGQTVAPGSGQGNLSAAGQGATNPSSTAQGGITQATLLNQYPSLGATMAANGNDIIFYNKVDGKFYRLDKNGNPALLSDQVFHEVQKITWSPDKNKAILEYPDQAKIIYNFQTKQQVSLPKHWKDFDFSPDGGEIVFKSMAESVDNRWLAVTNDQGTSAQRIAALGDNDETVYPSWSPNNQTVAMYTEGISFDQQYVFFMGLNDENFKALTVEGRNFQPKWAPRGDRLLYSVYSSDNGMKPELWATDAQGDNIGADRIKLNVQTWAEKCVFSDSANAYCAVPASLQEGAGLFPELGADTVDNLYKIDTQTGLKKLIAIPDGQYTMTNLIVSGDGSYLYFTDGATGLLNKIKLK